ncbi:hypothetical protein C2U68_18265 [Methylomonas koyamae]|nr:hypothetical protein C2U68_18265 [Methylomonas koyamae]
MRLPGRGDAFINATEFRQAAAVGRGLGEVEPVARLFGRGMFAGFKAYGGLALTINRLIDIF